MRRTRSIEDRIWCFVEAEDPSEGFTGDGGAADSESRGGPAEGSNEGGDTASNEDTGFKGADRTGTVDDPAYGTVDGITTNDDGSMTGVENFSPDDLPETFEEFIGVDDETTLFGTQDTTGTLSEDGFAFSTNTPLSAEAVTWIATALLPFGGALKALGVLGPFHPDEHIPSSISAEIDEFMAFLNGETGGLTPEQEEAMRKKYGLTTETEETEEPEEAEDLTLTGEGGDTATNDDTETETTTTEPPKSPPSVLGGHEIYVNGGFQVNYRAVEHVMRGVGEINFTTDAIRQLLEPPPGIGLEGGISVHSLPVTTESPEEVTLETYPPPGASVDADREPAPGEVDPEDVVIVEPPEPTLPPVIAY